MGMDSKDVRPKENGIETEIWLSSLIWVELLEILFL